MESRKRVRDMSDQELQELQIHVQSELGFRKRASSITKIKAEYVNALRAIQPTAATAYDKVVAALNTDPDARKSVAAARAVCDALKKENVWVEKPTMKLKSGVVTWNMSVAHREGNFKVVAWFTEAKSTPSGLKNATPVIKYYSLYGLHDGAIMTKANVVKNGHAALVEARTEYRWYNPDVASGMKLACEEEMGASECVTRFNDGEERLGYGWTYVESLQDDEWN